MDPLIVEAVGGGTAQALDAAVEVGGPDQPQVLAVSADPLHRELGVVAVRRAEVRLPGHERERTPRVRSIEDHQRSEEHTSELQSRQYLVCRLLLEKKK